MSLSLEGVSEEPVKHRGGSQASKSQGPLCVGPVLIA